MERPAVELLAELGWRTVNAYDERLGADGTLGRDSRRDVVLGHRLLSALRTLNPDAPDEALEEASVAISRDRAATDPTRANSEVYGLLRDGFLAGWRDEGGQEQTARITYVDWHDPAQNDLLAANQVWIAGDLYVRRVDLVLFVNGIPLVLAEFKSANRSVRAAFEDNLRDYRVAVPQLFVPNAFVIL